MKAALAKPRGERKSSEDLDHAVRQRVAKAIVPEGGRSSMSSRRPD
ncbi:MAG: hypothetical protein ABIU29_08840 [Chthoniobacterales bacterium]